jgi:hypothetical protein
MKIARHPVDLERIKHVFQWNQKYLEKSLEMARKNPTMLYSFLGTADSVYIAGSIVAPSSPEVLEALKLAAQAGTALYVFQHIEDPPRAWVLGEGPPVVYTETAGSSCAAFHTWRKVFDLCLITRQKHLSDELCHIPNNIFRRSDIVGATHKDYSFADLLRAVWTQDHFVGTPVFDCVELENMAHVALKPRGAPVQRLLMVPYLAVLRQLDQDDESGFTRALIKALQGHKKYWSSKKYCEEFDGFISLHLTAVAALAWDRGMRFEVESDYLPMSWVRGDLFRTEKGGR